MCFLTLEQQHKSILGKILELKKAWRNCDYNLCKNLMPVFIATLSDHHQFESEALFKKIWEDPKLRQGGPFCTYFFDFFMLNRPFQLVKDRINQLRTDDIKLKEINIPADFHEIFNHKSMLCIPVEEHIAIMVLTVEIAQAIDDLTPKACQWITAALDDLENLISFNIEKEEKCLWTIYQNDGGSIRQL